MCFEIDSVYNLRAKMTRACKLVQGAVQRAARIRELPLAGLHTACYTHTVLQIYAGNYEYEESAMYIYIPGVIYTYIHICMVYS